MGGEDVTEPSTQPSILDVLEGRFSYYLAIGMSSEEYWEGDPYLVEAYRKAQQFRNEADNERMWLQGYYNFVAISTAISNMHFDGKHHAPNRYMDKPLRITPKTEEEKEADREREAKQLERNLNSLLGGWKATHPQEETNG